MVLYFYWFTIIVFSLKLLGNLLLPYRVLRMNDNEGISLGLGLLFDWLLFFSLLGLAWLVPESGFFYVVKNVAMVSGGLLVLSYIHYFAVLFAAYLRSR